MLINKVEAYNDSARSFLTGDILWGVKQQITMRPHMHKMLINKVDRSHIQSRHLSENPSTYLR